MRSPFWGMDPYIETCGLWEDFHHNLITEIQEALAAVVPERYVVRAGERSYIVLSARNGEEEHRLQIDVSVAMSPGPATPPAAGAAGTAVLQAAGEEQGPVTMRALVETEYRESFLEIREVNAERKLVTCIQVLSPSHNPFRPPALH